MSEETYIEVDGTGDPIVLRIIVPGMPNAEIRLTRQTARVVGMAMAEGRAGCRRFLPTGRQVVTTHAAADAPEEGNP